MRNDTTQYFGAASNLAADEDLQAHASAPRGVRADSTARFFADRLETGAEDDATGFFGDGVDARDFFGEEPEPTAAPGEQDDMTRLFGAEDDDGGTPLSAETQFFTPEELDQEGNGSGPATDGYTGTTPLQALPYPLYGDLGWRLFF